MLYISMVTYLVLIGYVVAYQKLHDINRNKCQSTMKFPEDLAKFQ